MPSAEAGRLPEIILNRTATIDKNKFLISLTLKDDFPAKSVINLNCALPACHYTTCTSASRSTCDEEKNLLNLTTQELDDLIAKQAQELAASKKERSSREEIKRETRDIRREAEEVVKQKQNTLQEMGEVHTALPSKELVLTREKQDLRKLAEDKEHQSRL